MIEISTQPIRNCEIMVPGSKSYTHRILIAAALSEGKCNIYNGLRSEDTKLTTNALIKMGAAITTDSDKVTVFGQNGKLDAPKEPIDLRNSGTSMRLLTGVAALARGRTVLTGTKRMQNRPIQDLMDALKQLEVPVRSLNDNGCPPIEINGGDIPQAHTDIRCKVSSQYLSALLLIAPCTKQGLDISVVEGPVSKPYIDMTLDVMNRLGILTERNGYEHFSVPGNQIYKAGDYLVESDGSQAGYFWAAAAITGASVKVSGLKKESRQGDIRLAEILEQMGCAVSYDSSGITVSGKDGHLKAVKADMADMPDQVPTLAVAAAFADGVTIIENVAHLKAKECDRLSCVATELSKMGIKVVCTESGLRITGGRPRGAQIETYDDHRIAMSFAVAGLKTPGVFIKNEMCVEKSFPNYWEVFERLYKS